MSRKFNADILGRLADATTDELNAALAAIREDSAHYGSQPSTQENVDALSTLLTAATSVRGELTARTGRAADFAAHQAQIQALTDDGGNDADQGDDQADADGNTDDGQGDGTQQVDQPGIQVQRDTNATQDADQGDGDGNVTAAGRRPIGTAGYRPAQRARALEVVTMTTFANAGSPHTPSGDALDRQGMWNAWQRLADNYGALADGIKYPVVTVRSRYPEGRHLSRNASALANMEKVELALDGVQSLHARDNHAQRVTARASSDGKYALTAAGLCGPLQVLYDIRVVGDQDRPIRDSLVRFGADRGGIQYRPAMDGVSQTGGIGAWTATDDAAGPLVPKTCVEIACPGVVNAQVEAIYMCLTHSNMSTRFDPEFYDAVTRNQAIAHARFAENRLYTQLEAGSKTVYSAQVLGATRDVLAVLDHMVAYYRNVHRLNAEVPLRWIAPLWVLYMIRADITRQMVGDGLQSLAQADAEIISWFTARNVNPTFHLDGVDPPDIVSPSLTVPAQFYTSLVAPAAMPGFPSSIDSLLFAEGDWLYLDGGSLDMGVVRDSTQNLNNRFQTFSEEFGFPAFRGIESLRLVIPTNPTGQSAATKDTSAVTD